MQRTDLELCNKLLHNSRASYSELAESLGMSVNAVHKRVQGMLEAGVVRRFTTRLSLPYLGAVLLNVWGRSQGKALTSAMSSIGAHECTSWVGVSGGGRVYVTAHLRDISQMDDYLQFLRRDAGLLEMRSGFNLLQLDPQAERIELNGLDRRIVRAMKDDSRKSAAQIAEETGISVKTVRRRLDRMNGAGALELSIEWYPDMENDIMCMFHLHLEEGQDKFELFLELHRRFRGNMLYAMIYNNLPDTVLAMFWSSNMKGVRETLQELETLPNVSWVEANVLQNGEVFPTWRDSLP